MHHEAQQSVQLETTACYGDRATVSTIQDQEGVITIIDNANYGIRYDGQYNTLLPCNLPGTLRKEETRISFSGVVKETRLTEMIAGHPFVLTSCSIFK